MIQKITLTFLSLIFCLSFNVRFAMADGKSEKRDKQPRKLQIFLLIGQSNMAGRAAIEVQDKDSLKGVFLFTGIPGHEWEKAANPLNKYSTVRKDLAMQKLGPGYTFAKKMAEALPRKQIGLVVNAKGGTSLSEWMPGSMLYNEAVKRAKMAMRYGTLKGIVWHQGESDVAKSEIYAEKIVLLIQSLRDELGIPGLPFVAGQLSEARPERAVFNQMIIHLPEKSAKTAIATTEGTATIDSTHFNSKSQRLLGDRYADEMIKLLRK